MNLINNDNYYEPEYDPRSDEIEHRTGELMNTPEYNAYISNHIAEALSEMSIEQAESLQDVLDTKDFHKIGRKIWSMTYDYMEKFAKHAAETES